MATRSRHLWDVVTSGYLLVPATMAGAAVLLAFLTGYLDRVLPLGGPEGWFYSGESDAARDMLATIAGSIITVAGVVFSITVVVLTQASSQFGPRLLRNFMRDRPSQLVLGMLVATYVYSLFVLRTVRGQDGHEFIPHLGVSMSVVLAVVSIGALIYFIHHLATSLQPPMIIAAVCRELVQSAEDLRHDADEAGGSGQAVPPPAEDGLTLRSHRDGYIQAIDYGGMLQTAVDAGLLIRLDRRPGDHLFEGSPVLRASPAEGVSPELGKALLDHVIVGRHRTPEQDPEQAIRQLAEIAVRALSPGVNDPFTAINCVDALGSALSQVHRRGLPSGVYRDTGGTVRMVARSLDFTGLVDAAFSQIRQYGAQSPSVAIRLLEILREMAFVISDETGRQPLLHHARMVREDALRQTRQKADRDRIEDRYLAAVASLSVSAGGAGVAARTAQGDMNRREPP